MNPAYKKVKLPAYRNDIMDFLDLDNRRNHAQAMFEVDITSVNEMLSKRTERVHTVTMQLAYLLWCYGKAVAQHPEMQARLYKDELYFFEDVDISMIFEKEAPSGIKVPVPYVFRAVQKKSFEEIMAELQKVNNAPIHEMYQSKKSNAIRKLPKWLRMYLMKKSLANPLKWKDMLGTVAFTTLGMTVRNRVMYPVPVGPYGCMLAAGSYYHIKEEGKTKTKWGLVLNFDHNLVDGGPAIRFGRTFMTLVESGAAFK
jgi:pyruvate/2-oxoglutarate dehydrogenase complex dihydrolipoamide acyltransferase (E2) component